MGRTGRGKFRAFRCTYCKKEFKSPVAVVDHMYMAKIIEDGQGQHGPLNKDDIPNFEAEPKDRGNGQGPSGSKKS